MIRRRHPFLILLISLGFFLGQTCALIHASHHELVHLPGQPACAICAIAHAASLQPTVPSLPPAAGVQAPEPTLRIPRVERFSLVALPPSRAPPLSLV